MRGGHTIIGEAFRDSLTSGLIDRLWRHAACDSMNSQMSTSRRWSWPARSWAMPPRRSTCSRAKLAGADVMVISCARLIRIDFSAAGTLLNWVTARQAEGRQVQFVDVHRLVAAFFNVIGISEHARVVPRCN